MHDNSTLDISIVIPMYNAEKYIKNCLDSVLLQKDVSFEVILIDDGSTDDSFKMAQKYELEYDQIYLVSQKNGGVSNARNTGLDYSKGNFVFFLDIDDKISEGALSSLHSTAIAHNIDVSECKYIFSTKMNVNGTKGQKYYSEQEKIDYFKVGKVGYCAGKLIKRSIIEENNLRFDEQMNYGEDRNFILRLLAHSKTCCINKSSLYYVNGDNNNSLSQKKIANFSYYESEILESTLQFLNSCMLTDNQINIFYMEIKIRLLQTYLNNLYRRDSELTYDARIKIIKDFISDNKDTISSIENYENMSLYSLILNYVIKTRNARYIDAIFLIKNFLVKVIPRRH